MEYNLSSKDIKNIQKPNLRMTWEGATFERTDDEKDFLCDRISRFADQANGEVYNPGPKQRIPKGGAWAMITRKLPGIEGSIDQHIRVARFFFLEHCGEADQFGFLPDGRYMALCNSSWGTVRLWPYEYSVVPVPSILEMWQDGEIIFHPVNVQLARFNDIVFYARSRGILLADAMVLALGTLKGPVGWFEPRPDLAKEAEDMEEGVHRRYLPEGTSITVNSQEIDEYARLPRRRKLQPPSAPSM